MMEEVKSIISVVIIAALIGMCVGGLSEYLYTGNFFPGLAIGALSGVVIGAICNYAFIFVYFKFRNPLLAGILVFALITAGTTVFACIEKVTYPINLMIVVLSDIAGILTTIIVYRYEKSLNLKLLEKQKELKDDPSI